MPRLDPNAAAIRAAVRAELDARDREKAGRETATTPTGVIGMLLSPVAATVGIALGNGFARAIGLEGTPVAAVLAFTGCCAATLGWAWLTVFKGIADMHDDGPRAGAGEAPDA